MNIIDIMKKRRSIRKYNDKVVSDEDLKEIMEAALWAPSGQNMQPWYFVVIKSEENLKKFVDILGGTIFHLRKSLERQFSKHPQVIEDTVDYVSTLGGAKVVVLGFLYKDYQPEPGGDVELALGQSMGAAVQNMLLAASERGIGSCWMTAPKPVEKELCEAFAPGRGSFMCAVTLGYTDLDPRPIPRKEDRMTFI